MSVNAETIHSLNGFLVTEARFAHPERGLNLSRLSG
jgi:hypothetical protein